jgi:hypothetical protein
MTFWSCEPLRSRGLIIPRSRGFESRPSHDQAIPWYRIPYHGPCQQQSRAADQDVPLPLLRGENTRECFRIRLAGMAHEVCGGSMVGRKVAMLGRRSNSRATTYATHAP